MAKRIYTEEEARERKNARQREYAKRTGYAANKKYDKKNISTLSITFTITAERDLLDQIGAQSNKSKYIKSLIRADMDRRKMSNSPT